MRQKLSVIQSQTNLAAVSMVAGSDGPVRSIEGGRSNAQMAYILLLCVGGSAQGDVWWSTLLYLMLYTACGE